MTEEEYFRKNYPDSCYGDKPLSPHWDFFQDGVEFGERESEKKIEELEAKYYSVSEIAHHRGMCCISALRENRELEQENKVIAQNLEDTEIVNKALEKENAELKAQQFSLRNERNTFLAQNEQYEEDLIDFNDQLTKAKVCLEQLVSEITVGELEVDPNVLQQAENFLKDIEK